MMQVDPLAPLAVQAYSLLMTFTAYLAGTAVLILYVRLLAR